MLKHNSVILNWLLKIIQTMTFIMLLHITMFFIVIVAEMLAVTNTPYLKQYDIDSYLSYYRILSVYWQYALLMIATAIALNVITICLSYKVNTSCHAIAILCIIINVVVGYLALELLPGIGYPI